MSHAQHNNADVPAILDVEASGFGGKSYPIEVGLVLPNGHSYCSLILPEPEWTHWDDKAESVHHISRRLLHDKGRPVVEVARMLNDHLKGQTVYSDGWVNDYSWVGVLFDAAGLYPRFRLENLRALLDEDEADHWHEVKAEVARERGAQRHRASADARLLQLTLQRLRLRTSQT
jgi:hypothetical protein